MRRLVALVGPTATGKSTVAMEAARRTGAEILSVDSMQVYRGMDVGTAKPSTDDRTEITHHMIDICEPADEFSVSDFQTVARRVVEADVPRPVLIVGGSGLHFRSVVDPLEFPPRDRTVRDAIEVLSHAEAVQRLLAVDAAAAAHVDIDNPRRVVRALEIHEITGVTPSARADSREHQMVAAYESVVPFVGFHLDPTSEHEDVVIRRLRHMVDEGFVEEAGRLWDSMGVQASKAVGYREMAAAWREEMTLEAAFEAAASATMGLVRRQLTYFRPDPRLLHVPSEDQAALVETVVEALS